MLRRWVILLGLCAAACGGTSGEAGTSPVTTPPVTPPVTPPATTSPPTTGLLVGTDPYVWAGAMGVNVFTMNVDGTNRRFLTDNNGSLMPEWSCDGAQIVYLSGESGSVQIWTMNADGSGKKRVTSFASAVVSLSSSCNGKLLFGSSDPATSRATLWIMDSPTSAPRQLSNSDNFDAAGRISPDGTKVAFTRYLNFDPKTKKDEGRQLFVIGADGTGEKQLTFPGDNPRAPNSNAPAWSPDSQRIAFFNGFEEDGPDRTTPDRRDLAVINADGSGKKQLTQCDVTTRDIADSKSPGACADDPIWSPDGNWIAYSSGDRNTYIIASDGSGSPRKFMDGLFLFGSGGIRRWKR